MRHRPYRNVSFCRDLVFYYVLNLFLVLLFSVEVHVEEAPEENDICVDENGFGVGPNQRELC